MRAVWRFGRPHTLLGTALSAGGLFAVTLAGGPLSGDAVWLLAGTTAAALAANVFIVGLNQLTDVEIDRVNKPWLPVAAGSLSRTGGQWVVGAAGALAAGLGALLGPWLLATVAAGMLVGWVYSMPPIRLKRSAVGAALAIAAVRGPIVNIGLFAHYRSTLGAEGSSPGAWLLALFMTCFGVGIALAKDIPDVAGDRAHGIRSVAVRRGGRTALRVSVLALATAYFVTAAAGLVWLPASAAWTLVAVHLVGLGILARAARDATSGGPQCGRFYRWVWRLFYAEYVAIPLCILLLALPARS